MHTLTRAWEHLPVRQPSSRASSLSFSSCTLTRLPPLSPFGSFPLPEHTHTRARAGTLAPYRRQPILSSPSGFLIEAYSSYSSYSLSGERSERRSRSGWAGVPSWKDHTVASFEHSSRTGASFLSFHPGFLPRTRPPWLSSPPKLPTCPQVVRELKRLTGG
jgi:hypothetical protein